MTFSEDDLLALFYLQKYNFLTIDQSLTILGKERSRKNLAHRLLQIEQAGFLGSFGNQNVGFVKAPKVYYLKEKGYQVLTEEFPLELIGRYKKKKQPSWSSKYKHRLALIDLFLSLEISVRNSTKYELVKVFLEYNRNAAKDGGYMVETTDELKTGTNPQDRITPDGAFILKNQHTSNQGLYFLEMDMGTETITNKISKSPKFTLSNRMQEYDLYLQSGSYAKKYQEHGDFNFFTLLFVTTAEARRDNIRKCTLNLPPLLHAYYYFNIYETVKQNFFNPQWKVRSVQDDKNYILWD